MILLDTHTWVWWILRRTDILPEAIDQRIATSADEVAVASISCLEVALLVKKERLRILGDLTAWFDMALEGAGIRLLPLTPAIAARSAALPDLHRDPIDRVLIATAMEHDAVLLTKDTTIRAYPGVQAIWES